MSWLARNEPEVWEETRYFLMPNTFVVHRLTGAYVLDHPSASMCEPLYNVEEHDWTRDWAEEVAPGFELPELLWPSDVAGEITGGVSGAVADAVSPVTRQTPRHRRRMGGTGFAGWDLANRRGLLVRRFAR